METSIKTSDELAANNRKLLDRKSYKANKVWRNEQMRKHHQANKKATRTVKMKQNYQDNKRKNYRFLVRWM